MSDTENGTVWLVEWQSMADGSMKKVSERLISIDMDLPEIMLSAPYSYFKVEVR